MALQAQQIVTLACQIAKAPAFTSQCGQFLNAVLQELAQDYDLQIAQGTYYFNFNPGLKAKVGNSMYGSGPYPLPADWLRAKPDGLFWTLLGVPYELIPIDLAEFDQTVQQAGLQDYPRFFCTDLSTQDVADNGAVGAGVAYVYPPPSGAYPVTARYQKQMPDIATPETSATVPWFPNSTYLIRRCAGELMQITDDERAATFLGETPGVGAKAILKDYLKLANDRENRATTVKLDKRRFGTDYARLPNTKLIGF